MFPGAAGVKASVFQQALSLRSPVLERIGSLTLPMPAAHGIPMPPVWTVLPRMVVDGVMALNFSVCWAMLPEHHLSSREMDVDGTNTACVLLSQQVRPWQRSEGMPSGARKQHR